MSKFLFGTFALEPRLDHCLALICVHGRRTLILRLVLRLVIGRLWLIFLLLTVLLLLVLLLLVLLLAVLLLDVFLLVVFLVAVLFLIVLLLLSVKDGEKVDPSQFRDIIGEIEIVGPFNWWPWAAGAVALVAAALAAYFLLR